MSLTGIATREGRTVDGLPVARKGPVPRPAAERVLDLVEKTDACWLWQGRTMPNGYGVISVRAGTGLVHRIVYTALVGPIPEGCEIDHLCRVKNCVRPNHLEPVTHAENVRRAGAAKTHCIHGHEFTPENTYRERVTGRRSCKVCRRARDRARRPAVAA